MPVSNPLPIHLRPCREKVFGAARGIPLDRNAKARIIAYAKGYNARMKQPGQHWGPITRAYMQVLEALLFGRHYNRKVNARLTRTGVARPALTSLPRGPAE